MPKRFMAYIPGSTPVVVADTTAPSVPTNVTISAVTNSTFTVSWTASTDNVAVTGYTVQLNGTTYGTTTGATTLAVSGRAASTTYAVRVQANDAAGNFSALSTSVNATTSALATGGTPVNLYSAQTPSTTNANDGQGITLSTRFVSDVDGNVTGVRFYRATTAPTSVIGVLYSDAGVELARATFGTLTTGWNSVTFASPVATTANTYYRAAYWTSGPYVASSGFFAAPVANDHLTGTGGYYGYSATPASGTQQFNNGAYFADVTFVVTGTVAPATIPAVPAAPSITAGNASVTVTWVAPNSGGSAITGYDVQPFAGSTGGTVKSVGNVLSTTITGLTNGTAYTVKVRAKNTIGNSAYSAASAAVTPVVSVNAYPDETNTGVPAGTVLTTYTGPTTITTANTIIDSKTITSALDIRANNVTIRNCRILVGNASFVILHDTGTTGLVIQDTEIDGLSQITDGAAIGGRNYTCLRVNVHGTGDGAKLGDNVTWQDSYIHDLYGGNDSHNDGLQCSDGTNIRVLHNTILPVYPGATSCIIIKADFGPITDLIFDGNFIGGGGWCVYGGDGFSGLTDATNVKITNNKFTTAYYPNGGAFGPITNTGAGVTVTGNTWADGPKAGQTVS